MSRSVRAALLLAGLLTAGLLTTSGVAADGGRKALDATMAGIPASLVGQVFQGATGGGLPWRLEDGRAKVFSNGHVVVEVEGLVLDAGANAGKNPIPTGRALVACGGTVVAMSDPVPFSPTGDAEVDAWLSLPSPCLAPVVFFAGNTGAGPRWFAVTGF